LVAKGAEWRYLDDGTDPGVNWRKLNWGAVIVAKAPQGPPMRAVPGKDGYLLSWPIVNNLKTKFNKKGATPKKMATAGDAVMTSTVFVGGLRKTHITVANRYKSSFRWSARDPAALNSRLASRLKLEHPELVRFGFIPPEYLKGKSLTAPPPEMRSVIQSVLDGGAVPVLITAPIFIPPNRKRPGGNANSKPVKDWIAEQAKRKAMVNYNQKLIQLATEMKIPCIAAGTLLNSSPDRVKLFGQRGMPSVDGLAKINEVFAKLYKRIESPVFGRGEKPKPKPKAGASKSKSATTKPGAAKGGVVDVDDLDAQEEDPDATK
jgi:hypothetical protein